jgi:hypothetical protein
MGSTKYPLTLIGYYVCKIPSFVGIMEVLPFVACVISKEKMPVRLSEKHQKRAFLDEMVLFPSREYNVPLKCIR